jgi:zinc transport system permease protein
MLYFNFITYGFIQRAYIAGSCVAVVCALLGLLLVLRNLSLIGDGLSHVSFGAIALGLFFGVYPPYVAVPVVIAASFVILRLTERAKVYGDAAIGIVSSVGIATGVILAAASHGFNVDLFSYLFGNILAVNTQETVLAVFLSLLSLVLIIFFYHDLFSTTFDEQYAGISGVNTRRVNQMLLVLTAVTVVLATRVVGVMLVSALLILPAVSALQIARGFRSAMIIAAFIAVGSVLTGVTVSFFADLPAGATVIMVNFGIFVLFSFLSRKQR